ncbi:metallo-beta-lactamase superfamily protein [Colletotrichum godetiae]|uniref:Metallo-beta-lactamase superfamily protein n=1 Tax=Colletotrichum godetiae TaxID=1209918 RepID=A0AAJ0AG29_9PEZI|nr:metallo-beta-lactamase superfamily protein [Colletotrichum godetiae]KAK1671041.1 metallo-beta-lactamase superfamily protein [Colletotrichum godetiae]
MSATSSLNIPPSKSTVSVSIIDTTLNGDLPTAPFMGPTMNGFERWYGVGYAFLVTHQDSTGKTRRVVFDLGLPKDWDNDFSPAVLEMGKHLDGTMIAQKYVSEILTEGGLDLGEIEALFWSHAHPDHIGRPSLFPSTASLIVGPGVKDAYFPGYPTIPDAPVLAREFEGREVREVDFSSTEIEIGGLKALDYFNDGSFYLLSAPGHAIGHINALARTTEDSFMYFAGDSFHHSSVLRPHNGATLPEEIQLPGHCCSGRAFHAVHPVAGNSAALGPYSKILGEAGSDANGIPFHAIPEVPEGQAGLFLDLEAARETVRAIQKFDASPDVFVVASHDSSLVGVVDVYPADASGWKGKGWKESGKWLFLKDFERAVELADSEEKL